ncbi:hypothetical protein H0H81_008677 [Sphagnurus paluster]|uniref:Uncharacterized protein n=1 Tax=Sphagnurus paluster TaxID=117069 RepID=A0A9P7FSI6_9AGAR|nr:hypothetical protein H0H81_008677 [Sphagnurus paluster]
MIDPVLLPVTQPPRLRESSEAAPSPFLTVAQPGISAFVPSVPFTLPAPASETRSLGQLPVPLTPNTSPERHVPTSSQLPELTTNSRPQTPPLILATSPQPASAISRDSLMSAVSLSCIPSLQSAGDVDKTSSQPPSPPAEPTSVVPLSSPAFPFTPVYHPDGGVLNFPYNVDNSVPTPQSPTPSGFHSRFDSPPAEEWNELLAGLKNIPVPVPAKAKKTKRPALSKKPKALTTQTKRKAAPAKKEVVKSKQAVGTISKDNTADAAAATTSNDADKPAACAKRV